MAEFGTSDDLQVGQYVLAMGSPLSLSRSISAGVISTKDRYFSSDVRLPSGECTGLYNLLIQTDAAINPGNSGGPLVDLNGRVIGINSRATLFANNIGFAIPINVVKEVTKAIIEHGGVTRSWIGLHCQALQEMENYFGAGRNEGVLVASVDPGSPADAAFMKAGDVILAVDGQAVSARFVEELPAFYDRIAKLPPGTELNLKVLRNDQTYYFEIVTKQLGDLQGEDFECKEWGFTVKGITRQMQIDEQLEDTVGVLVSGVKPVGAADDGGLQRGSVVTMIDDQSIHNLGEMIAVYQELETAGKERVMLTVKARGATRFVLIRTDLTRGGGSEQ